MSIEVARARATLRTVRCNQTIAHILRFAPQVLRCESCGTGSAIFPPTLARKFPHLAQIVNLTPLTIRRSVKSSAVHVLWHRRGTRLSMGRPGQLFFRPGK
jgi:hypothetical protein